MTSNLPAEQPKTPDTQVPASTLTTPTPIVATVDTPVPPQPMGTNKNIVFFVVIALVIAAAASGGVYYYLNIYSKSDKTPAAAVPSSTQTTATTATLTAELEGLKMDSLDQDFTALDADLKNL